MLIHCFCEMNIFFIRRNLDWIQHLASAMKCNQFVYLIRQGAALSNVINFIKRLMKRIEKVCHSLSSITRQLNFKRMKWVGKSKELETSNETNEKFQLIEWSHFSWNIFPVRYIKWSYKLLIRSKLTRTPQFQCVRSGQSFVNDRNE